ncbi:hypothetical protein [Maritimibacter sp. HL-12]|jgi:predicted lysophospholipase L1 biosynthesis ABC-type transport system permease subunit|uniref:hypothetical protein n=1 Tax=Maritimibacter sp. HL-12 TaxID=1162418 RepID=UPI000A0F167B|nr:hypothetical protein [Maritimibacter sp. HL-12]SMH31883.1 hypothetical protein SAMN05661107_0290 [Maritimibacter sp. HL-12]
MEWLIIIGAIIAGIGLVGLVVSLVQVMRAKRAGLDDEALKKAVARALPLNMAAFALSAFGLMMVVVGVILG